MIPASSSSWRITQSTTVSISRPSTAAACNNGASSAWERLAQCEPCVVPAPTFAPAVIARAINSAPSQSTAQRIGDHRSAPNPCGSAPPVGSNSHSLPDRRRARQVANATSVLVEVQTAGPVCAITAGMITALVFPDRGGPSNSTARSGRANRHPCLPVNPRYTPPPARRANSQTAASGSSLVAVAGAAARGPAFARLIATWIASIATTTTISAITNPPSADDNANTATKATSCTPGRCFHRRRDAV